MKAIVKKMTDINNRNKRLQSCYRKKKDNWIGSYIEMCFKEVRNIISELYFIKRMADETKYFHSNIHHKKYEKFAYVTIIKKMVQSCELQTQIGKECWSI